MKIDSLCWLIISLVTLVGGFICGGWCGCSAVYERYTTTLAWIVKLQDARGVPIDTRVGIVVDGKRFEV